MRQPIRTEYSCGGDDERKRERERSAQSGLIVAKISVNKPSRDSEKKCRDCERGDGDCVRIVQPLA